MMFKNRKPILRKQRSAPISILFWICILFVDCATFGRSARSAEKAEKVKANYQVGYLENRDFKFDPFRVKNFISLLKFEIIRVGNGLIEDGTEPDMPVAKNTAPQGISQSPEAVQTPVVPTMSIAPSQELAKPVNPDLSTKDAKRILSETEIRGLATKMNFDYYLQGSFGISDSGGILDRSFTTLIFIDVYDRSGKLVRSVSYTQESKHFSEADDLKNASVSIVDRIVKKTENSENKTWWKLGF
ncbi:lipoprotein [Leptospira sp. WS92.C1]